MASLVVPHLKKEDELVHPIIIESSDERICQTGIILSRVAQEISREFEIITDEILKGGGLIDAKILENFEAISNKIRKRIILEESVMFPAYEECVKA